MRLAAEDGVAVNLFFSAQQFPLRSPSTNRCSVSRCPASAPHPGSCACSQAAHSHSRQQPGAGSTLSLTPMELLGFSSELSECQVLPGLGHTPGCRERGVPLLHKPFGFPLVCCTSLGARILHFLLDIPLCTDSLPLFGGFRFS